MLTPKRRRRARQVPAAADDTPTRILDAAERLFAERGIESVSVRSVLAAAGVNVALAHYHFGSREGLISALLEARVAPRMAELARAIEDADARGRDATLEDVLRAYFAPAARWMTDRPACARLFAQLQTALSPDIRALGEDTARGVMNRLAAAVLRRMPGGLSPKQVFLRFWLTVGGPSYLAGHWERVLESARRRIEPGASFEPAMIAEELVVFTAAGLRAVGAAVAPSPAPLRPLPSPAPPPPQPRSAWRRRSGDKRGEGGPGTSGALEVRGPGGKRS